MAAAGGAIARRRLVPFLDLAYLGFAVDLDTDAAGVRLVVEQVPEALVAVSFSKNLGLYRERVGALIAIGENETRADAILSHVLQIARSIYSMPPDHGAAIAAHIFADRTLKQEWIEELAAMRTRIADSGICWPGAAQRDRDGSFDFIRTQRGMFFLLGVSAQTVRAIARQAPYLYDALDSRMNLAGIMPHNANYVADAIAAERLGCRRTNA